MMLRAFLSRSSASCIAECARSSGQQALLLFEAMLPLWQHRFHSCPDSGMQQRLLAFVFSPDCCGFETERLWPFVSSPDGIIPL